MYIDTFLDFYFGQKLQYTKKASNEWLHVEKNFAMAWDHATIFLSK